MINRQLKTKLIELSNYYPVVSVMGCRQSGKSTLVKDTFPDYDYIDLEDHDVLVQALDDPKGFIEQCSNKTIIDEAQFAPELFSAIKVYVDQNKEKGHFILSGSQNFLLSKHITQSLAGRVGITELLPLAYKELYYSLYNNAVDDVIINGAYPGLYVDKIPPSIFYSNYLNTYIERDAGTFLSVRNIVDYENFIRLLAANVGQLLNYSHLARDIGVDLNTIKNWISLLVSSYIIKIIPAFAINIKKRIVKSPKVYFTDTGLLCYLLGIKDKNALMRNSFYGHIYENFIFMESIKKYTNSNSKYSLFYYRDTNKNEIDLIDCSDKSNPLAIEIKATKSIQKKHNKVLKSAQEFLNLSNIKKQIVYRGNREFLFQDSKVIPELKFLLSCDYQNLA